MRVELFPRSRSDERTGRSGRGAAANIGARRWRSPVETLESRTLLSVATPLVGPVVASPAVAPASTMVTKTATAEKDLGGTVDLSMTSEHESSPNVLHLTCSNSGTLTPLGKVGNITGTPSSVYFGVATGYTIIYLHLKLLASNSTVYISMTGTTHYSSLGVEKGTMKFEIVSGTGTAKHITGSGTCATTITFAHGTAKVALIFDGKYKL